jgi:hypothetical protein
MVEARWLFSVIAVLVSIIVTYILTRQSRVADRVDRICRKQAESDKDLANLAAAIYRNDLLNRMTKIEQHVHDLDQSMKHNIPELFAKWDQLVCDRQRKDV